MAQDSENMRAIIKQLKMSINKMFDDTFPDREQPVAQDPDQSGSSEHSGKPQDAATDDALGSGAGDTPAGDRAMIKKLLLKAAQRKSGASC